jgi:hypothetical protein
MALSLADRLNPAIAQWTESIRQHSFDLRCGIPGIIQSFDETALTAVVQVAVTETINTVDTNGNNVQQQVQIPLLPDVPVMFPRAGNFILTFPVQQGDECWIEFADNHYGFFWQSGNISSPGQIVRRHDLSDAVCYPTGISQPKAQNVSNFSTTSAQLRSLDGNTIIDVQDDQITITTQTVTVNASGDVTVNAKDATVKTSGDTDVQAQGNVNVTAQGNIDAQAQGTATVKGSSVNVTGSSVTLGSSTTVDGVSFLAHTHSGVMGGGGITGPVVG